MGDLLRRLRKERGMTQQQVGEELHVYHPMEEIHCFRFAAYAASDRVIRSREVNFESLRGGKSSVSPAARTGCLKFPK